MGRRLIIEGADFSSVAADTNIMDKLNSVLQKNYVGQGTVNASSPTNISKASITTRDCVFGFDLTTVFPPESVTKVRIKRNGTRGIVVGLSANANGQSTYFYNVGNCSVTIYKWITASGDIIIPIMQARPYLYLNFEKTANSTHTIFDYLDAVEIVTE